MATTHPDMTPSLELNDVTKRFRLASGGTVTAVDGVSITIPEGGSSSA